MPKRGPRSAPSHHMFDTRLHEQRSASSQALPIASMMTATEEASTAYSDAGTPTRLQAFRCFEQTWHRLRWKLIGLSDSYRRTSIPLASGFTLKDAERNFKLDFEGFYALIEQAIVNLLHIFRVSVQRQRSKPKIGGLPLNGWSRHSYHHDVLNALDENGSLRATLGTGSVNQALWQAKELRNRWKDPGESEEVSSRMYDMRWIVMEIMGGLEAVYAIALKEVEIPMGKQREIGQAGGGHTFSGSPCKGREVNQKLVDFR
ncbi:hypothetical protein MAC_09723 [Metarhizium acridum CQMa 102]|uniref:Fungal specific transcription factor n=1 Tax=Metarhizium acridum (strain CQMa 102) TaxID=655827 RepID=E9EIM5_METAQ|nr:uncharacterized protein MAC_09723 [Metarhizium acridum CQMa 102]EFY84229.1 hypothetical protein MAC_09723 [Metarhizium acridum CQMa 102]